MILILVWRLSPKLSKNQNRFVMVRQTMYEINHKAIQILCKEIGIVNTLRFIHQFSNGSGNYTEERRVQEQESLNSIIAQIKEKRNK